MRAIDVHGHFGVYDRGLGVRTDAFMTASADQVAARGLASEIEFTVVSAIHGLIPYRGNAVLGNADAAQAVEANSALRFWTIIDPHVPASYAQSDEFLGHPGCVGIKIHPHAHQYEISEHGAALFDFAAARNAVVLAHSGDVGSYPEDFVPFANRHPSVQIIMAHLGNSDDGSVSRQVEAIEQGSNGNLWTDTSSSRSMYAGLIEWAVDRIGFDRILFGTDTPLYWAGAQKGRIETADISPEAKAAILWNNAERLLEMDRTR